MEKTILINNLEANYKIAGSGPAVLILHGWGGSSSSWVNVQKKIAAKGYKVICPDFPGFGKSKTPLKPWGVDDYVQWVIDFTDSQNIEEFFLVAHSFGGKMAIKFAIKHPQKIKGLIFCGATGIKPKLNFLQKATVLMSKIGNAVFSLKPLIRLKNRARNIFYIFLRHKDYVKAKGTMRETMKKVLQEDLLESLPKIKTKTLIIWGKKDRMVPEKFAHIFQKEIQASELKIFPKAGHSPHLEIPEKLSETILNFLQKF